MKVNWVLSEPPRYEGVSDADAKMLLGSGVAFCPSIDYLERAWQDAVRGRPSEAPYLEVEVPTTIDKSLTDDGSTVVTMFTQYGPYDEAGWPEGSRERYGQQCLDTLAAVAPNVQGRGRAPRGARPARPRAHLRAARRQHLPGRAGARPDGVHAPDAGARAVRDAGRRAVPVRRRHAPGRRRDGGRRAQRGQADPDDQKWKRIRRAMPSRNGHARSRRRPRARDRASPRRRELTPEQAELQGRARRFVEEVLIPLEEQAERAAGDLPDEAVARIRSEAMAAELHGGLHAREHGGQGWSQARVGAGRGAVRALDQRALVAHPERLQRARERLARADRPLAAPGAARRAARRLRGHRGARGLRPVGHRDDRAAARRRLGDRRREVVRHLRRRRGGLHRDGERRGRGADAVPRRRARCRGSRSSTTRRSRTPIRTATRRSASAGVEVARRRRDRRRRRGRRAAARVVHRGAARDRGARRRLDVAAARGGDRVGAGSASRAARRIMDHQGVSFPLADSRRRRRGGPRADARRSRG